MSESYVIQCAGLADGRTCPASAQYLLYYDPDAYGGRGKIEWTWAPDLAKRFPTHGAAMKEWHRQSTRLPRRGDGKPNRPLTAYTVLVTPVQE